MAEAQPQPANLGAIREAVRTRTFYHRRNRIVLNILLIVGICSAMVYVSMLQRDSQKLKNLRTSVDRVVAALVESHQTAHAPLAFLPGPNGQSVSDVSGAYFYNIRYISMHQRRGSPVGVFCSREPATLFLQEDGRYIVLYNGEGFSVQWMPEPEFDQQARGLGLGGAVE